MLSMKTLKVAVGTVGAALLLGAGSANAAVVLDDTPGDAVLIAAESLREANKVGTSNFYAIETPSEQMCLDVATSVQLATGNTWYIGVRLEGMQFNVAPTADFFGVFQDDDDPMTPLDPVSVTLNRDVSLGAMGDSYAIFSVRPDAAIERGHVFRFLLGEGRVAVTGAVGQYGVSVRAYDDLSEAIAEASPSFGQRVFGGDDVFVEVINAVTVNIDDGTAAVADVANRFRTFTGTPATARARLGSVSITARSMMGTRPIYDATVDEDDDATPDINELLVNPASILDDGSTVTVTGHGDVGNVSLAPQVAAIPDDDNTADVDESMAARPPTAADCLVPTAAGSTLKEPGADDTFTGLRFTADAEGNVLRYLCFDAGAASEDPIPVSTYAAEVDLAYQMGVPEGARLSDTTGTIGQINRNGTTVRLTYLTDAAGYNQRVIIVNRSQETINYDLDELVTEPGITATLLDGASGMVAKGEKAVVRVGTMIGFEDTNMFRRRAAATLSVDGPAELIEVATTQVNISDSSTDTVVYASEGGIDVAPPKAATP